MSNIKRLIIVEDHILLRQTVEAMIALDSSLEVVGLADNGKDAIELANTNSPDLMLMDLSLPIINGIDAITKIKKRHPLLKILVLTVHLDKQYVRGALDAGADGYSVKYDTQTELMYAIKSILCGRAYLSPYITNQVICGYITQNVSIYDDLQWRAVTPREREVLKLVAEGYVNQDVANFMHVSLKTVKTHRANLMKKLNLHSVASLTVFAIQKGLIVNQIISDIPSPLT